MKRTRILVAIVFPVTLILSSQICFAKLGPAQSHFQSALAAAEKDDFAQAIEQLKTQIDEDPRFTEAFLMLANFFYYTDQITSGEKYFNDAILRTPENANAQLGSALISHYLGIEERAFEHARLALDYGVSEPAAMHLLVESALQINNLESMQAVFRRLKKNPAQSHLSDFGFALWKFRTDNLTTAKSFLLTYLSNRSDDFAYQLLGDAYLKSSEFSAATSTYRKALQLSGDKPQRSQISLLRGLGTAYFQLAVADTAAYYLSQALNLSKKLGDLREQLEIHSTFIKLYHDNQRYPAAIEHGTTAISLAVRLREKRRLPDLYCEVAAAYEQIGDYQRALKNYLTAAADSFLVRKASAHYNAGRMLAQLGSWTAAADHFDLSMAAAPNAGFDEVKPLALMNLANLHQAQGDWEHAIDEYSRALRYVQDAENHGLSQSCLLKLANLYLRSGIDLDFAGHYLILADAAAKQTLNLQDAANIRWMQGRLTLAHQNVEKAETYFLDAIQLGREIGSTVSILAGNAGLLETYLAAGFYDLAAARADSAIKLLQDSGARYLFDHNAEIFDLKKDLVIPAIAAYSKVHQESKIYYVSEMYKAHQHMREMAVIKYLLKMDPPDLQWKLDEFEKKINHKWGDLWSAWRSDQQDNIDMSSNIKREIIELENQRLQYRGELERTHPQIYSIIQPVPEEIDVLKRRLADLNSVFIHYIVGENSTEMIVVRVDSTFHRRTNYGAAYLKNLIEQISPVFSDDGDLIYGVDDADKQFRLDLAGELYKIIFEPIKKHLPKNCILIISPDDILNRVPWECLVSNNENLTDIYDDKNAHFLVEDYAISYVPYAKFLGWPYKKASRKQKSLIAFSEIPGDSDTDNHTNSHGNGVSKTKREAKLIAQLVGHSDVYSGDDASKDRFLEQGARYKAIHLTQPLVFENGSPLYSKFYFRSSKAARDSIESRELFDLQLTADIVVLSEISRHRLVSSENEGRGLSGFLHALNYCGVQALAPNLWQVSDEAKTDLLLNFYERLKTGLNTSTALQQTKIACMSKGNRNPLYWSGLVVYGSPATTIEFDRSNLTLIGVAAGGGVALMAAMVLRHFLSWKGKKKRG